MDDKFASIIQKTSNATLSKIKEIGKSLYKSGMRYVGSTQSSTPSSPSAGKGATQKKDTGKKR